MVNEKLQKVLARAGLGSRRELETWIAAGRININGRLAILGDRIALNDTIEVDNKVVNLNRSYQLAPRIIIYHKPEGEICTRHDPIGRRTIFGSLPQLQSSRWVSVGRLDIKTSGLLLLTNDGEIANRLMHPSYQLEREYAVRVFGEVDPQALQKLKDGVMLEDGMARFNEITPSGGTGQNHWYYVVLNEGRNREVRRLWESQAVQVNRLIRVRFGMIRLPRTLRAGQWLELSEETVNQVMQTIGLIDSSASIKVRKSNFIRSKKRTRSRPIRQNNYTEELNE